MSCSLATNSNKTCDVRLDTEQIFTESLCSVNLTTDHKEQQHIHPQSVKSLFRRAPYKFVLRPAKKHKGRAFKE